MRRVVFALILTACREDPAFDVVRLPQTAYGPFDAATSKPVADAGPEASDPQHVAVPNIGCWLPDEPLDDEEEVAEAPFDNCPVRHDGGKFDAKSTAKRRARTRDICCYANMKRSKVITLPEID